MNELNVVNLLVSLPENYFLNDITDHSSPPGWAFAIAFGSVQNPGTYAEWYAYPSPGLQPGEYLSGFSITSANPPRTAADDNYDIFSYTTESFIETGSVVAPTIVVLGPALPISEKTDGNQLFVSQASDGSIVITLTGSSDLCCVPFVGQPTWSITGENISVSSATDFCECAWPPFEFPRVGLPYSISVKVGRLADGDYSAAWSILPPMAAPSLQGSFIIRSGVPGGLKNVPALSWSTLFLLSLIFFCIGWIYVRRITRTNNMTLGKPASFGSPH